MAPSESFVMTVTKKFRDKTSNLRKCLLNDLQHTDLWLCRLKCDEGAERNYQARQSVQLVGFCFRPQIWRQFTAWLHTGCACIAALS